MEVKFRAVYKEDIAKVAAHMREIDRKELALSCGREPLEVLQQSCEYSQYSRCIELNGEPVALFGVRRPFVLSRSGLIWLLGTEELAKMKKSFVMNSLKYVNEGFEFADRLENYVWINNKLSIRWLKWCGFTFDEPKPYGEKQALFLHFYKEKKNV